jgi:hypothetical protein
MNTEKTKIIILIIGVILACLLLIQGFGYGLDSFSDLHMKPSGYDFHLNKIADIPESVLVHTWIIK